MKKLTYFVFILVLGIFFSACSKNEDDKVTDKKSSAADEKKISQEALDPEIKAPETMAAEHTVNTLPVEEALLLLKAGNSSVNMPNSIVWGKISFDDLDFKLNYNTAVKPSNLRIGRDHPNGTRFLAIFPGVAVHLPLDFASDFGGFDEYGDINEKYYVQVAEHDFDNDGSPEIVLAVGDGLIDLAVNIVKYHSPQSSKDAGRVENWELVGSFTGQSRAIIDGDTISLPIGSVGLSSDYTWVKKKFVESN